MEAEVQNRFEIAVEDANNLLSRARRADFSPTAETVFKPERNQRTILFGLPPSYIAISIFCI